MRTGAPNVRPPKKKLITLDEVTHNTVCDIQLGVSCSCLASYIFLFCFQHLLCKYELSWWSSTIVFSAKHNALPLHYNYCCLSHEECFRFSEHLPTPRQPIWRLERPNWERWLPLGRTGFHLKMNVRSLSISFLSFPSVFNSDFKQKSAKMLMI